MCKSLIFSVSQKLFKCRVLNLSVHFHCTMSVFTQRLNPMTGKSDWEVHNDNYDFHQEVARSSFADMLHDTERNNKYEQALKAAVSKMHSRGLPANVLDIGTGTGLLSMMAVRSGADSVVACEAFKPMSVCALNTIRLNGLDDKIIVIPKRSTDLTVGENGDLKQRANILVTEVFDTELIGEGALSTFKHAHQELLENDCIVIPHTATIYAQVVDSPYVQNWNTLKDIYSDDDKLLVKVPDVIKTCPGSAAVHDLQMSQLPRHLIKTVVSPQSVLKFDLSGKTPIMFERSTISTVKAETDGIAQAIFMWWELNMDINNKILLSCAPKWAHPEVTDKKIPWRDHWMQAIYYLPHEVKVTKGQEIHLISCHDEFSLWFNLRTDLKITDEDLLRPICTCGTHITLSRTRIGQLNDKTRINKYLSVLKENIHKESVVLVLSHSCYVGLSAAKFGAQKVYVFESNSYLKQILHKFIECNGLVNIEIIDDVEGFSKKSDLSKVNVVFGEPYFASSILPWDNLMFMYLLKDFQYLLCEKVTVLPATAVIKAVAVAFDNLHKIRCSLGRCEGFLMKYFDDLIDESSSISDSEVEPQPLWEYPGKAVSDVVEICKISLQSVNCNIETTGSLKLKGTSSCNGIALWVDWQFGEDSKNTVTTGPTSVPNIDEYICWDVHTRQGVRLFQEKCIEEVGYKFRFDYNNADLTFHCE